MDRVDAVVIGAGVVGLAVARALAQAGREVLLLERATVIGQGVSSRNSEVIHAGLYYAPHSLKARWCVRGKALLYDYCRDRALPHARCGKWIVASDESQIPALQRIERQGQALGVPLHWLNPQEIRAGEPELNAVAALSSPSTGIVDAHGLMLSLLGDAEAAGAVLALCSEVLSAEQTSEGLVLNVRSVDAAHQVTELQVLAQVVVNAAGLGAPDLARQMPFDPACTIPQAHYAKGNYFSLSGATPFQRLIYPAPQDAWLGVHATLDLAGQCRFGPDLQWLETEGAGAHDLDYTVDAQRGESFYAAIRRYWPALPDGGLQPAYSGIRPKIHGPNSPAPDFLFLQASDHGVPGLYHLLGIESPGLTSALGIGEAVAQAVTQP